MFSAYTQRIVHCAHRPIYRVFSRIFALFSNTSKILKISSRFTKSGDKSAERTATGRPSGLREISHTGWREWDNHMMKLKRYLRDHYPDMNTICPDPMKPDDARCGTDPEGLEERKCLYAVYKDTNRF